MRRRDKPIPVTEVPPGLSDRLRTRQRWYAALMGTCILLVVLAWNLVRLWSTDLAVAMSAVAAVLPPVAVVVANWHEDH